MATDDRDRSTEELQEKRTHSTMPLVRGHAFHDPCNAEHLDATREPAEHRRQQERRNQWDNDPRPDRKGLIVLGALTRQPGILQPLDKQAEEHDYRTGQ